MIGKPYFLLGDVQFLKVKNQFLFKSILIYTIFDLFYGLLHAIADSSKSLYIKSFYLAQKGLYILYTQHKIFL